MVKQGSFFHRLKQKWGSGSGVRMENPRMEGTRPEGGASAGSRLSSGAPRPPAKPAPAKPAPAAKSTPAAKPTHAAKPTPAASAKPVAQPRAAAPQPKSAPTPAKPPAAVKPVEPAKPRVEAERTGDNGTGAESTRPMATTFRPSEVRSSRKVSDREEAMLVVGKHFQELATLMRGSQAAQDEKLQKIVEATSSTTALGAQQLETLKALSTQMEKQNDLGVQLSSTMTKLPNLLENVEKALDRAAKTDERTAATVKEFQSTMDRIHTSMDKMVDNSGQQAKAAKDLATRSDLDLKDLAGNVAKAQEGAVHELKKANQESLQSLRRTHEDQSNRLQRVVQENAGWNRAVLVGIGLVVIGIGAVVVLQLIK